MTRYFVALLPPAEIQDSVNTLKEHFAEHYASEAAQKSPPHITLQPPFDWSPERSALDPALNAFAQLQPPLRVVLSGFAAFAPRVIYIRVQVSPELSTLQRTLADHLQTLGIVDPHAHRPFTPHVTIAFRDLTRQHFKTAWSEFEHRRFDCEFTASSLALLVHDTRRWNVGAEFPCTQPIRQSPDQAG